SSEPPAQRGLPEADRTSLADAAGKQPGPKSYDGGMSHPASSPTGIQVHLSHGGVTARIAQVGASLRHLTVGGVDIVPPYPDDIPTPMASGVVLAPWPNRIRDGVWHDGDETRALAITEPKFHNASHGLLRY